MIVCWRSRLYGVPHTSYYQLFAPLVETLRDYLSSIKREAGDDLAGAYARARQDLSLVEKHVAPDVCKAARALIACEETIDTAARLRRPNVDEEI